MLVYHKSPMGYSEINGRRLYGRRFANGSFGPLNITWKEYLANYPIVESTPYTHTYIEGKFGRRCPDVTFSTAKELSCINIDKLAEIAHAVGIDFIRTRSYSHEDKLGLAQAIIRVLETESA